MQVGDSRLEKMKIEKEKKRIESIKSHGGALAKRNESMLLDKLTIHPLEYKLNKERLERMGISPSDENLIILPKFG
jgi:hypothetical protein